MPEWRYVKQGKQSDPVAREELQRMAAAGELDRADPVWTEGMTTWTQAGAVDGIFPAASASLEYAGFGLRAVARLVDYCGLLAFGMAAGLAGGVVLAVLRAAGRVDANWIDKIRGGGALTMLFGLGAMLWYHAACEGLCGTTLGKLACGLRVQRDDGALPGIKAGAIRNAGFLVDSLFFGLVAYFKMSKNPRRQRYGDAWAGTSVVKAGGAPAASRPSGGTIAATLLLGAGGAAAIDLVGLLVKALI